MPQALKVPPNSIEAECSVLGAILLDKNAVVEIAAFLRPAHFYKDDHSKIFDCILELYEEREPIDSRHARYVGLGGPARATPDQSSPGRLSPSPALHPAKPSRPAARVDRARGSGGSG